ncbi:MAG: MFS transporter [Chloroflexi bacterium]|nr:MFS transporter [Chloroflexota bacterium]
MAMAVQQKKGLKASALQVVSPLKERNFALLMAGRVTSNMGRNMRVFARAWLVLELTNSPFLLGLVTSSLSWPMLFMPFVGGILADRIDRRKLVLYTEFALVVLWGVTSLIITLGWIQWWHLMITSVMSGVIQSIGRPGHHAMVGSVVTREQLASAAAIDSAADHWPRAIGLLVATLLIVSVGTEGLFWLTAALQLVTGITLLFLHWKPQEAEARNRSVRGNALEGLSYVKNEPVIFGVVLVAASASLLGGGGFLMPIFARDILGVGAQGLGTLMLASTLGVSIGSALVMILANFHRRGMVLVIGSLLGTAFSLGFAVSTVFYLSIALTFLMGLFQTVRGTTVELVLQLLAPNEMRGRVMSLRVSIQGLSWIGVLMLGALAEAVGAVNTMLIAATASGVVAVVIFIVMPQIRRFR